MIRIGIDTGGTFTDLVVLDDESGEISTVKVPSTPDEPALAPLEALKQSGAPPGLLLAIKPPGPCHSCLQQLPRLHRSRKRSTIE